MTERVFNFSPGPAVLPEPVLAEAQRNLMSLPGLGMSILEIGHRSKPFVEIQDAAEANLRNLLAVPAGYSVLFLQGGARLQFSMAPMNLLGESRVNHWGKLAFRWVYWHMLLKGLPIPFVDHKMSLSGKQIPEGALKPEPAV